MDYDGVRLFEVQRTFMGDVPLLRGVEPSWGWQVPVGYRTVSAFCVGGDAAHGDGEVDGLG